MCFPRTKVLYFFWLLHACMLLVCLLCCYFSSIFSIDRWVNGPLTSETHTHTRAVAQAMALFLMVVVVVAAVVSRYLIVSWFIMLC